MRGNDNRKKRIKRLLSEKLTLEKRQEWLQIEAVEKELEKQWKLSTKGEPDLRIKGLIWGKIQRKCAGKQTTIVHRELW